MVIDDRPGDSRRPRDRLDRDPRVALLQNDLQRRVEQLLASLRRRHARCIALARRASGRRTRGTWHGSRSLPRSGPGYGSVAARRALRSPADATRVRRTQRRAHSRRSCATRRRQGRRPPRSARGCAAGGVRGAIFAVFADGPDGDLSGDDIDLDSHRLWGRPLPDPLDHAWAAGVATRAAGRLAALELAGEITIARVSGGLGRSPRRSGAAARRRPPRRGGGGDRS